MANQTSRTIKQYFEAFNANDLTATLQLFSPLAVVRPSSAKYSPVEPKAFYTKVFDMTIDKAVVLNSICVDVSDSNKISVHFDYKWSLKDGSSKHFPHAFDLFELDPSTSKINLLTINLGVDVLT